MAREIVIPHSEISNSQTITDVQERIFKEHDVDMHKNEVDRLEDDHKKGVRVLTIRNTKYFGPWSKRR